MQSVARIGKLFGRAGEVMVTLYSTFPTKFDTKNTPLFAKVDGLNVPLYLEKFERRGRAGAVVAFADIDTERRATEFLSMELYMAENGEQDPQGATDDEFTMQDLVGFAVEATVAMPESDESEDAETADGQLEAEAQQEPVVVSGVLVHYYDNSMNPLFGVEIEGREVLIPAAEEFIGGIDFEGRRIVFILPQGLLEL